MNANEITNHKRNGLILKLFLLLAFFGALVFIYWLYFLRFQVSTEDAQVAGNMAAVMASQPANIVSIYADNTNYVQQGQLLVQLDTTLFRMAFQKAKINLALAAKQAQSEEDLALNEAKEALREAYIHLQRCNLYAPISGYVAQRTAQVGEWASTTEPLMRIISLEGTWIEANFKETELNRIRVGQSVKIQSDLYGSDVIYHGKVEGILAGTGSIFSLIPPQNATGNWIKVVQRVPVRISLDPNELKEHPLLLGLSVYVEVDTEDMSGEILTRHARPFKMTTPIYQIQMEEVENLIQEIVQSQLNQNQDV